MTDREGQRDQAPESTLEELDLDELDQVSGGAGVDFNPGPLRRT